LEAWAVEHPAIPVKGFGGDALGVRGMGAGLGYVSAMITVAVK
jgi:hypothetical protein